MGDVGLHDPTSVDQGIPDQFKTPFWESQPVIKSYFGDMRLSISDSILGVLSCFHNMHTS